MEKFVTEYKLLNGNTFDVDTICSFNFDVLKESLKYLYNQSFHQGFILDDICKHLKIKNKEIKQRKNGLSIVDRIKRLESIYERRIANLELSEQSEQSQKSQKSSIDMSQEKEVNDNNSNASKAYYKKGFQELTLQEFPCEVNSQNVIERVQIFEKVLRDVLKETNVHSEMIDHFSDFVNSSFETGEIKDINSHKKNKKSTKSKKTNHYNNTEINEQIEKLSEKIELQVQTNNEFMNIKFPDLRDKVEGFYTDFLILSNDYKKMKEENFEMVVEDNLPTQDKLINNSDSNKIQPIKNLNPTRKQFLKDPRVAKAITELQDQLKDLKTNIDIAKRSPLPFPSDVMEIISKSKELIGISDQFSTKIELRSLNTLINNVDSRVDELKLQLETSLGEKKIPFKEFEELKLKINSIDTRSQASSKNVKMLENRVNDIMFTPHSANAQDKNLCVESFKDNRVDAMIDEFNEKLVSIRDQIKIIKTDLNSFNGGLSARINTKVGCEALIELENKIYKEFDKVISSLTRKINSKVEISRLYLVEGNVKKLFNHVFPSTNTDSNEEEYNKQSELLSCASCKSNLVNLCIQQQSALKNPRSRLPNQKFEDKFNANIHASFKSPQEQRQVKHSLMFNFNSDEKIPQKKINILHKKNDTFRNNNELMQSLIEKVN